MAPPGRLGDREHREMNYAVERYRRDGRDLVQQNGRAFDYPMQVARWGNPGQAGDQVHIYPEKAQIVNYRTHQNASAVTNYSSPARGKIRQGKSAAAVAQMHQNDLHNIDVARELPRYSENGGDSNGLVVARADRSKNYIKQHLSLQGKLSNAQNSGSAKHQNGISRNSDLRTSFDPMKDRHMWTMWRTAVNGRIVDEVRLLERIKSERGPSAEQNSDPSTPGVYGKALVATPLKRFIRFDDESNAYQMSSLGQGSLETSQFVYYGLPRVVVSPSKK